MNTHEDDRKRCLDEECESDERVHTAGYQMFESDSWSDDSPTIQQRLGLSEVVDDTIGPYIVRKKLGEGGMGIVYLVEQKKPIRRFLAVKVIRPGMDSKAMLARFESERQALAMMDHPNIARVLDAGTTKEGRPFFAMECVNGPTLDKFCQENQISLAEKLRLFTAICSGVQHAHQKALIHRDIKPSNILISREGDEYIPKIVDFGLAKAIGHRLTEDSLFTAAGQFVGTPEYISPEQVGSQNFDVDTRADIYSLGSVLFWLLTGSPPIDMDDIREHGVLGAAEEIRKRICEEVPKKPSSRVEEQLDEDCPRQSATRKSDARKIRGDLDWITLKCLEKDPARRYSTATDLSSDIMRYIRHEPVKARPPSFGYQLSKVIQRNRKTVLAGFLLAISMVVGIVGTSFGWLDANSARADLKRQLVVTNKAKSDVERESKRTARVKDFLEWTFSSVEPGKGGRRILLIDVLNRAVQEIPKRFHDEPRLEASLYAMMGKIYWEIGSREEAKTNINKGLAMRRSVLEDDDPDMLKSINDAACVHIGDGEIEDAECLLSEGIEIGTNLKQREAKIELGRLYNTLAVVRRRQGKPKEAELISRRAIAIWEDSLGDDDVDTLTAVVNLGVYLADGLDLRGSLELLSEAYARERQSLSSDHPLVLKTLRNLGAVRFQLGNFDEARELLEEACVRHLEVFDRDHPETIATQQTYSELLQRCKDYEGSLRIMTELLPTIEAKYRPGSIERTGFYLSFGLSLTNVGRYSEAERYLLQGFRAIGKSRSQRSSRKAAAADLERMYRLWRKPERARKYRLIAIE